MWIDELQENPTQFLLTIYKNKKIRNYILLTVLVFILIIIAVYRLIQWLDQPTPGANRVLICTKCDYRETKKIDKLSGEKCPKCGKIMGYGWKCKDCDYEYSLIPNTKPSIHMTKQQILNIQKTERQCPNCNSTRTGPMSGK